MEGLRDISECIDHWLWRKSISLQQDPVGGTFLISFQNITRNVEPCHNNRNLKN